MSQFSFRLKILFLFFSSAFVISFAEIYIENEFNSSLEFFRDWTISKSPVSDTDDTPKYNGIWEVASPHGGLFEGNNVLLANEPSKHYSASRRLENIFKFDVKPFILQYEVSFPNGMSCGGAYIKLLSSHESNNDLLKLNESSPYTIMFGPDICGTDKKIHFIFRHFNRITKMFEEKHLNQPDSKTFSHIFSDEKFHHLLLQVNPDNTFLIQLDGSLFSSGSLLTHFTPSVNLPELIDDPDHHKPSNWDDDQKIPDQNAIKPEDWDESAQPTIIDHDAKLPDGWLVDGSDHIPDPSDTKPGDWNDEIDGEWTPSIIRNPACSVGCGQWTPSEIPNPKYKGKWTPPLVDNPNYKGIFKPRKIKNPDYFYDSEPYKMTPISTVMFELWVVSAGIGFDNLLITDDIEYSKGFASKTISMRTNAYRMKKVKEIVTSSNTLKISSGIFGGILFILFIYFMFLRTSKKEKDVISESENPKEQTHSENSEETDEVKELTSEST